MQRIPETLQQEGKLLKIPHMGWNRVEFKGNHHVFRGVAEDCEFYFVHSYYPSPADGKWAIGWTDYGIRFCAVIAYKNLIAMQFHPEKSGRPGLNILKNFCSWEGGYNAE